MKYVGLTDDPETRKVAHGNPLDWWHYRFNSEQKARQWEKNLIASPGYTGGAGGEGWRYGYTYTITSKTKQ